MFSSGEDTGEYEEHGGAFVEEFEAPVVDANLVNLEKVAGYFRHSPNQVRHDDH